MEEPVYFAFVFSPVFIHLYIYGDGQFVLGMCNDDDDDNVL